MRYSIRSWTACQILNEREINGRRQLATERWRSRFELTSTLFCVFAGRTWSLAKRTTAVAKVDSRWRRGRSSSSGATNGIAECAVSNEGRDRAIEVFARRGKRGRDRKRDRKRKREREREKERMNERTRVNMCEHVCMCVRKIERKREKSILSQPCS